jgi:ribose transport system substrate-binding protein
VDTRVRAAALLFTGMCCAFALGACGDDSSSGNASSQNVGTVAAKAVPIDVGLDKPITVDNGKPKIGMLIPGTNNDWLRTYIASAQAEAKRLGVKLDVISANWDVQRQIDQMQNAIQSKKYDAWITAPIDSNVECKAVTKDPAAAGIVVSLVVLPACGRDLKPISDVWSPGTLNMVNGQENIDYKRGFLDGVSKLLPGSHKVIMLYGPELNQSTKTMKQALGELLKKRPDLKVVASANTDFTTPTAFAKTQTLLQAHPEADTVISVYSDITRGAIQAIKAAGKDGKINVFDQGGSKYSASQVAAGALTATTEYDAIDTGAASVRTLVDAFAGKKPGPRFVDTQSQGSVRQPYVITKANVGSYKADY